MDIHERTTKWSKGISEMYSIVYTS